MSATIQQPDLSTLTHPASQTTMTIDEIGTQKSSSTTKNIEEIFTQQAESTAHHILATTLNLQQNTTNHASVNEDNNSSYFSCVSDWHMWRVLFDQDDLDRFPPHTCVYTVHDASFKPSWSWVTYSHKKNTTYLCCLGVFICPMDGCKHVSNAVLSNDKRRKDSIPKPCGSGLCFTHKCPLTHMSCDVNCTLIWTLSSIEIKQHGSHRHPRPHAIKASKKAVQRLQDIVNVNSEVTPLQVMLGTPTREPARSIHPSLGTLSRLSYMMSKFKSSSKSIGLKGILSMQVEMGVNFIQSQSRDIVHRINLHQNHQSIARKTKQRQMNSHPQPLQNVIMIQLGYQSERGNN
jgi:hypothetical protein